MSVRQRGKRVGLGFAAALLGALSAEATPEPPAASASAAPTVSASATPAAPAQAKPPAPSGAEIPSTPSELPTKAEWDAAKRVGSHRGSLGGCKAYLVREWLKLRCPMLAGAGLIAGDPTGVSIEAYGNPISSDAAGGKTLVMVQLPLRRGEARIVSFVGWDWSGYDGIALEEAGTVSVLWRPGRSDPVLVASGWLGVAAD